VGQHSVFNVGGVKVLGLVDCERRFYGWLVLERMSKIVFGKIVWSSFKWLLAMASV
jgi:hypothetical protein